MGEYTLAEGFEDAVQIASAVPLLKAEVDAVAAIPSADRKPSDYLKHVAMMLTIISPLADSVDAHIKSVTPPAV